MVSRLKWKPYLQSFFSARLHVLCQYSKVAVWCTNLQLIWNIQATFRVLLVLVLRCQRQSVKTTAESQAFYTALVMKLSKKFTSVRGKWIMTPGVQCVTCEFHKQDNCLQLRTTGSLGLWEGEVTKCMNSKGEEVGLWWWSSTNFRSGWWCKNFISGGGETKIFYCWMHWWCIWV